ncbi:MAG TPA: hypothetical protein VN541_20235 [Tepidisphaeraceae bacterium]|nr:hypothetical protein [Tepidisphaeraceae bacterium]
MDAKLLVRLFLGKSDMVSKGLIVLFLATFVGGCAAVYPQQQPKNPTAVYLADYGVHSSLMLPTDDGRYVEYAFGDWNYAAMNHCWPNDALGALLVSTHSTLGRRYLDVLPGQTVPHPVHYVPRHLTVIYASREAVRRVVDEMNARWRRDCTTVQHNPENDMDYVPDSEHYWIANNCNHLTARCLQEMGCDIWGLVVVSNFWVEPQKAVAPEAPALAASPTKGLDASARAN